VEMQAAMGDTGFLDLLACFALLYMFGCWSAESTNCFKIGFNEPRLTVLVFDATLWPSRAFASFYFQVFKEADTNWKCYTSTGEALRRHDCGRGSSSLSNSLQWQSADCGMVHASAVAQQYGEMHCPQESEIARG
jgi:hypothetical protein